MSKLPFKILTISWDPTLAMAKPTFGDVQRRNIEYGKYVEAIQSITYSSKNLGLKQKQLSENVFVYPTNSANRVTFLFKAWKIAKGICLKQKIDLVLTQDPFLTGLVGSWIKKKFGCRLLIHFHGDFFKNPLWLKEHWWNFIFLLISKFTIPQADAIRAMSQGQKNKFIRVGITEKKIRVISTPIDLEKYNHPNWEQVEKFKKLSPYPKILHVSRRDEVKDFYTLYKAFDIIYRKLDKKVHFWQVGADLSMDQFKKKFPNTVLSLTGDAAFRMDPQVELNSLINIYHANDIIVLSSTSESFGKVLVEANTCGKPVVSTATTGAKEIIQDGYNGFLVPIGAPQALADKILYLLNNPEKAQEMGENGKRLVKEKFDGKKNTEMIIQFWQDIIEGKL